MKINVCGKVGKVFEIFQYINMEFVLKGTWRLWDILEYELEEARN